MADRQGLTKYKFVFVGEQAVGKTSIINRFMYDTFDSHYQATIGIDFLTKTMYLDDRTIRLQLWDTAGQERFRSLIPSYIRDSSVAVVVYDITNLPSFIKAQTWIEHVRSERGEQVIIALVGNKCDLENTRAVSTEEGQAVAKEHKVMFTEASAKGGDNIKLLFKELATHLPGAEEKPGTSGEGIVDLPIDPKLPKPPSSKMCGGCMTSSSSTTT